MNSAGEDIPAEMLVEVEATMTRNQAATVKRRVTALIESTRRPRNKNVRPDVRKIFQVSLSSL